MNHWCSLCDPNQTISKMLNGSLGKGERARERHMEEGHGFGFLHVGSLLCQLVLGRATKQRMDELAETELTQACLLPQEMTI